MEYAIGKILYISGVIARVQTLFYSKNGFWTHSGLEIAFPPSGKVFAPNLPFDFPAIKANDIIRFNYVENTVESGRNDDDDFIIPRKKEGGTVWRCPQIFDVTAEDVFKRKEVADSKELCFFFRKQGATSYICGPVWSSDLSPKTGKEVKGWSYRSNYDTITDPDSGNVYLAVEMDEFIKKDSSFEVDCMSYSQLKDWLKGKLKDSVTPEVLKLLKDKIKELSSEDDHDPLTKERFARVRHSLSAMSFDWSEIQSIRALPGFKNVVDETVRANIDTVLDSEQTLVKAKRAEVEEEQKKLDVDLTNTRKRHETEKKKLEAEFKKLEEQINFQQKTLIDKEAQYNNLVAKQEELIELIKIQSGIIGRGISHGDEICQYPLEILMRKVGAKKVSRTNKDAFCDRVNESLEQQRGFMRKCLQNLPEQMAFKTDDIRTGIFLASVLSNSVYQLCQPSPKWISFKEFWQESLQNIWDSAHNHSDVWHFLLIENCNIALPECWGMPLWNIITHKTKNIPFAIRTSYPRNLRIIVSIAEIQSEDNSHMGLPTHIADKWISLNVEAQWWDKNGNWDKFVEDMINGLAVNDEYFCPVDL